VWNLSFARLGHGHEVPHWVVRILGPVSGLGRALGTVAAGPGGCARSELANGGEPADPVVFKLAALGVFAVAAGLRVTKTSLFWLPGWP